MSPQTQIEELQKDIKIDREQFANNKNLREQVKLERGIPINTSFPSQSVNVDTLSEVASNIGDVS